MLYNLVRPLASLALRIFMRSISISHAERIPVGKPVVLAVNHPTAFMEPCILACFLDRPLYFLVRGDVFSSPLVARVLRMLNMLPMYRLKDRGFRYVKENFQTLDACYDALLANKTIMILAEGTTIAEKRLRPLKKGAARLAFGALDKHPELEDVWIVPVGVNFDYMDRFRAEVMIDVGIPLSARAYYGEYLNSSQAGIDQVNEALRQRMEALMVIIPLAADEWLTEQLFQVSRSTRDPICSWQPKQSNTWLLHEKKLADYVYRLSEPEKSALKDYCVSYRHHLSRRRVTDYAVSVDPYLRLESPLLYLLAAPFMLLGYLGNWLPAALSQWITRRTVKDITFYAPVLITIAMVLYLLYYTILVGLSLQHGGVAAILLTGLCGLTGVSAICYRERLQAWLSVWRWRQLAPEEREAIIKAQTPLQEHLLAAKQEQA